MDTMPGTMSLEDMQKMQQMQYLADALRQDQPQQQMQPQGQVQPIQMSQGEGSMGNLLGNALGQGANWLGGNLSAANTYGTTPLSQQTRMLQSQDAGLI